VIAGGDDYGYALLAQAILREAGKDLNQSVSEKRRVEAFEFLYEREDAITLHWFKLAGVNIIDFRAAERRRQQQVA
jgi:hypothetical protein